MAVGHSFWMIYCTLKSIKQSNLGTDSADDFPTYLKTRDLNFTKLGNNASNRNQLVVKALSHLDDINFDISNTEADVVGYAHEYWIGESASGARKKPGEFYTPQKVSTLSSKMVTQGKERLLLVYDPTCGSGYLLLWVKNEGKDVERWFTVKDKIKLFERDCGFSCLLVKTR